MSPLNCGEEGMRQSGSVPQAWTSHWPGLKPVTPFRIIFWCFPRATQSGGQGNVKVCPSDDGVCAADGQATTAMVIRSKTPSGSTPRVIVAPPWSRSCHAVLLDHRVIEGEAKPWRGAHLEHSILDLRPVGPHHLPHRIALGIGEALG